ncbi:MAG: hypothetical protein JXM70_03150, partial [Pirellulales bacterium]|nr:hypothetical protein [Pirellulales bacterium]
MLKRDICTAKCLAIVLLIIAFYNTEATAELVTWQIDGKAIGGKDFHLEAGVTYRKGYRLELTATEPGGKNKKQSLRYYQTQCTQLGFERFVSGDETRSVAYGGIKGRTSYLRDKIASMFPPLALKLNPSVLVDQNELMVEYAARLNPPGSIEGVLVVVGPSGKEVLRWELTAKTGPGEKLWQRTPDWQKLVLDPA